MLFQTIQGADKTTVSVATGNTEFHPFYYSSGNLHNDMRRAHQDGVIPMAFLSIPKCAQGPFPLYCIVHILIHISFA
jgi:hypothetical protein